MCDLFIFICLQLSEILEWQVVCTKVREGDKRIVRLKEGDVSGHHVVIVDDLVQSGGTLIECQVNYQSLNQNMFIFS
jgi:phosphoribosylpyrophosphate synthetase